MLEFNAIHTVPGYSELNEKARTDVQEVYGAAYESGQHLGVKVAQGIAFEAATQRVSDEINEELIAGHKLNDQQRKRVLGAYVHRHTHEHKANWAGDAKPTQSDDEWIKNHAFHFNKKTGELSSRHKFAEPHLHGTY